MYTFLERKFYINYNGDIDFFTKNHYFGEIPSVAFGCALQAHSNKVPYFTVKYLQVPVRIDPIYTGHSGAKVSLGWPTIKITHIIFYTARFSLHQAASAL